MCQGGGRVGVDRGGGVVDRVGVGMQWGAGGHKERGWDR